VLARAGLLDGRRAVTHWQDAAALQAQHPAITVQDDAIYIRDGALYTSAGIAAGIDLALALVEEDRGRAAGLAVAKRLVVFFKRPGGQRQFSAELLAQAAPQGVAGQLTAWLRPRLRSRWTSSRWRRRWRCRCARCTAACSRKPGCRRPSCCSACAWKRPARCSSSPA
jgi:transcriptional regulator GlxA family with amidase domain